MHIHSATKWFGLFLALSTPLRVSFLFKSILFCISFPFIIVDMKIGEETFLFGENLTPLEISYTTSDDDLSSTKKVSLFVIFL